MVEHFNAVFFHLFEYVNIKRVSEINLHEKPNYTTCLRDLY